MNVNLSQTMEPAITIEPGFNPRGTILIVDDHKDVQNELSDVLKAEKYELQFAANGYEAVDLARTKIPDLIILDALMPGMDGFTTIQKLRQDKDLKHVPIIMVTAVRDEWYLKVANHFAVDAFLQKPIQAAMLKTRVKGLIRLNTFGQLRKWKQISAWLLSNRSEGIVLLDDIGRVEFMSDYVMNLLGLHGLPSDSKPLFSDLCQQAGQVRYPDNSQGDAGFKQPCLVIREIGNGRPDLEIRINYRSFAGPGDNTTVATVTLADEGSQNVQSMEDWTL